MNTVLYMVAAVLCGAFAFRAWSSDRQDPINRSFVLVGVLAAISFGAFSLYLLPGLLGLVYVHGAAGAMLPAAILWFLERLLQQPDRPPRRWVWQFFVIAPFVAGFYLVVDIGVYRAAPRASPAQIVVALYVLLGWILCLWRLWGEHQASDNRVDRVRIRYLLAFLGATAVFTALEQLLRSLRPAAEPAALGALARSFALQGALPPLGAVAGTLFIYFLYQIVKLSRLLDLHEIFSRVFTLAVASLVLVVVDGVTVLWIGAFTEAPVQATFQVFLASVLFLTFYDPLRARLDVLAGDWFNRPGRRLELSLAEIDRGLAKAITLDGLDRELLQRLQDSGRVPRVSLYLWDEDRGGFSLARERGDGVRPNMQLISSPPFAAGFAAGEQAYVRADLERSVRRGGEGGEEAAARLRTMEAMNADLTMPILSGGTLLGWLNLQSEPWADGFSHDEVRRLLATVNRAAIILGNIHSAEQIEEQRRLAALGTMSAGLAHEIRNPLASIKGAAQFLHGHETETDPAEMADFLDVIVDEVDRLNLVVSQFLDYARSSELECETTDLNLLVGRVLDLVRAEEPGVEIHFEPGEGLPVVEVDSNRLRQVLLNLVRNALQAVGGEGRVTLRTARSRLANPPRRGEPSVAIVVEDDGEGIEAEDIDKLFIPFFTTKRDGTGLGLAISRRLVEAHGGEIGVRSQPGRGSTFIVRLPT